MFTGTKAIEQWATKDYLPTKMGHLKIPIVRNARVGTLQDDRVVVNFADAFNTMYASNYSKEYLFFPVKSRFTFPGAEEGSAEMLQDAVNAICSEDLEFEKRFWPGFGKHRNFLASQFVIGKSTEQFTNETTGSDYHCAGGNNWFIQVHGRKQWEFIEPRYSHYMYPLKGGFYNFWNSNKDIATLQNHIPRWKVIIEPGDMVFNPDWMWHKITSELCCFVLSSSFYFLTLFYID
jgi:hypothetical protein